MNELQLCSWRREYIHELVPGEMHSEQCCRQQAMVSAEDHAPSASRCNMTHAWMRRARVRTVIRDQRDPGRLRRAAGRWLVVVVRRSPRSEAASLGRP
jgi:hypothetical protein